MLMFTIKGVHVSRVFAHLLCVAAAATFIGCGAGGPERVEVRGKVTLNGQPLDQGTISFIPTGTTQGPTTGAIIENGAYVVPADKGAVLGSHLVQITSVQPTGRKIEAGPPEPTGTMVDEVKQVVPAQYNTNSTLTIDIQSGVNENVDFEIEAPKTR